MYKDTLMAKFCKWKANTNVHNYGSLFGWELTENNTGLARYNIDKNSLPEYNEYINGEGYIVPPAGTIIREHKITKSIWLINGNITIDRCWIRPENIMPEGFIYSYHYSFASTYAHYYSTIIDCDIDGEYFTPATAASGAACGFRGLSTIKRCNIYAMGTGIGIFNYTLDSSCIIEGNYIHDLRAWGDPESGGTHNSAFTIRYYTGPFLLIRNNKFVCTTGNDSGAIYMEPYDGFIDNVYIKGNLIQCLAWCMPLMSEIHGYGTNMNCINNRFQPDDMENFGPASYVRGGPGWKTWSENYYYNAADIDGKGSIISGPQIIPE